CRTTFQLWEKTCIQCGIVFQEFYERRAWGTAPKPPSRPAHKRRRAPAGKAGLAFGAALVLGVCVAAIQRFRTPPLPPGAFADAGKGLPAVVGEAVFTPGEGENYLLRFYSNEKDYPRRKADWTAFLDSVRRR